ncbi:MAG: molybdopterin-synthase adenylyltransferase MoeB [Bacteroidota bacterium]|nr:molybdopterin-synthase adenylyltransferase MoeB [Bacteroidota bacterium]MDP4214770.1 molybdopterin-synthase adenylyltransferase MoeB [Bacteroidota bacterium]MDP4245662.1 molybdopterin-synthase adenylyltransferase MoeB [Bacteroidota bacterium]MDP4255899.1 molybdopterin-synthase adenylyltransferase MoeB [Bacteroidota bacterium]MDP4256851.1 molybdopterin-synthase adenylyltransferase MoeB [Bacteroidota bacterium]
MATVIIPTPLRKFTNNTARLQVKAGTIKDTVQELTLNFPDLKKHLLDEGGNIRSFVNIFVGNDDIRNLQQDQTAVKEDTVISIVPAIAGGSGSVFTKEELARYNRHIIIPEFGMESQEKLKAAKVLVIGSGGLGSPVLLYLAAAGVGTLGIVDFDVVDDSNLQRQVIFGVEEIGKPKVEAARRRLQSLNPHIHLNIYNTHLNSQNALDILRDYDVIADGTDNFPTRYLVNDASVLLGKTNVYASIFQFEGQVSVFNYRDKNGQAGPNYRDLYPTPPPPGLVPSCAEGGVLGVLPGIIGSLQALEVIKVITGVGETLSGRFFIFDALNFESRTFTIKAREDNPINGRNPTITELIDYEQFCGMRAVEASPIKEITARELYNWQVLGEKFQLVDVREPHEFDIVNIGGELIPLATIAAQSERIDRDRKVVVHCKVGGRSAKAIRELEEKFGFTNLYNLKGGILSYIDEVQPELTRY